MRFYILAIAIFLWFSSSPISAHFFPNISSIPPWLLLPNASATAWDKFQKFNGCHSGEKVNGLAKLKQYFQHFGYIPNSNFTDDFDGDFESALKTYQKNFNLNETGELDEQTLKQIVRPRCGIADIINGTTTMNSRKYSADGSHRDGHFHTTAHYSFFPNKPLWPENRRDLTYSFLPDNQLSDTVRSLFRRAFQRWSEVIPMTFTETSSFYTADIKIGFFSGDHGDGEPFDGVLGTLAHAFSPPSGRFHLDGDENWVINGDVVASAVTSAVDLESVAVHEIGHLLGLGHSSVEDSIMFPTISAGTRKVELHSDDIEGVQVLYGPNPNYNGTSSTTTTTTPPAEERDTGNNSGSCRLNSMAPATVLLSVGVLVLVLIL